MIKKMIELDDKQDEVYSKKRMLRNILEQKEIVFQSTLLFVMIQVLFFCFYQALDFIYIDLFLNETFATGIRLYSHIPFEKGVGLENIKDIGSTIYNFPAESDAVLSTYKLKFGMVFLFPMLSLFGMSFLFDFFDKKSNRIHDVYLFSSITFFLGIILMIFFVFFLFMDLNSFFLIYNDIYFIYPYATCAFFLYILFSLYKEGFTNVFKNRTIIEHEFQIKEKESCKIRNEYQLIFKSFLNDKPKLDNLVDYYEKNNLNEAEIKKIDLIFESVKNNDNEIKKKKENVTKFKDIISKNEMLNSNQKTEILND